METDILQNVLFPPRLIPYNNVWGVDFIVLVMDAKEICAEIIMAMSDRDRYRDYYDLFWVMEKYKFDINEILSYVARKEIRKAITKANILHNWEIVGKQKQEEMSRVFYARQVGDDQIKRLIDSLLLTEISSPHNELQESVVTKLSGKYPYQEIHEKVVMKLSKEYPFQEIYAKSLSRKNVFSCPNLLFPFKLDWKYDFRYPIL